MDIPNFKNVCNQSGESLLPHRPPFLFVDTLIAADETGALGEYTYTDEKNDFFKRVSKRFFRVRNAAHFPGDIRVGPDDHRAG